MSNVVPINYNIATTPQKAMKITLDVKEVAGMLGVSTQSIYTMARENQIPHVRVRARILFHRDTIEAWLRGQMQQA